jgi:hypothetical protein
MTNISNETIVNFSVSINELNIILAGLRELPHRISDEILKKLMENVQTQISQSMGSS